MYYHNLNHDRLYVKNDISKECYTYISIVCVCVCVCVSVSVYNDLISVHYSIVKEEITDDTCGLPLVNGRVVAWVSTLSPMRQWYVL